MRFQEVGADRLFTVGAIYTCIAALAPQVEVLGKGGRFIIKKGQSAGLVAHRFVAQRFAPDVSPLPKR